MHFIGTSTLAAWRVLHAPHRVRPNRHPRRGAPLRRRAGEPQHLAHPSARRAGVVVVRALGLSGPAYGLFARAAKRLPAPIGDESVGDAPRRRVLVDEHLSGAAAARGDRRWAAATRAVLVRSAHAPAYPACRTIVGITGGRIVRFACAGVPRRVAARESHPSHVAFAHAGSGVRQICGPAARGQTVDRRVCDHSAGTSVRLSSRAAGVDEWLADARGIRRRPAHVHIRPRAAGYQPGEKADRRAAHASTVAPARGGANRCRRRQARSIP